MESTVGTELKKLDWSHLSKYFSEEMFINLLMRIGLIALAVIGGMIVVRYLDRVAQRVMERIFDIRNMGMTASEKARADIRKRTLSNIAHHGMVFTGYLILTLMVLDLVGLDIRPILATAGVASLAIGFGAQSLVKDIISGFFILLEDQYGQGDTVNLDGDTGVVENLNLRTTHLRNAEGVLIIKNNGSIGVVRNMTKDWSRIDFKIGVSYSSDLPKVFQVLMEEGASLKNEYRALVLEDPAILGVESFNESDITVRMFIKVQPGEQFQLRRVLNKKVKERFDREGIEIPFPQRTVWTVPAVNGDT